MNKKVLYRVLVFLLVSLTSYAQHSPGDVITVGDAQYQIIGANLIANPGFEEGLSGWTDATSTAAPLSSANFTVISSGGVNNSSYLVGTKNESSSSAGSIGTGWNIASGKKYYFSYQVKYLNSSLAAGVEEWLKVSLTNTRTVSSEPRLLLANARLAGGGQWTRNELVFTNADPAYAYLVARFRWLDNRLGFDDFMLYEVEELVNVTALEEAIAAARSVYKADTPGADDLLSAITVAESFLSATSPTAVAQAIADLNAAVKLYQLKNASADNPMDVTHLIVNPGFDQNTPTGWKGIGVINYHVVEFYQRTFNMTQRIAGLPAGKYVLRAQAYERPGSNDGGAAYRAGTETIAARVYAKSTRFPEKSSPFNSIYKHSYTGTGSQNGYVNTMAAAETLLSNPALYYDVTVSDLLLQEGDTLVIGAQSDFQQASYWALFDNFRLEYHGAYTSQDVSGAIAVLVDQAQALLNAKIQNAARTQLTEALTAATELAESASLDELVAINNQLVSAYKLAGDFAAAYSKLQTLIEEAELVYPTYSGTKAINLLNAITLAKSRVANLDISLPLLNSSISSVNSQINKKIYASSGMLGNIYNPANNWSIERSKQSKNWIIFWEPGYGEDPTVLADGNYRIDIDGLLALAERTFDFYTDSLKFITRGKSKTDDYKMIIRLRYTRDWEASGSGIDDRIGLLTLTAWSAQVGGHTLAHEVGHCFQYQVHCDNNDQNGWMYGFGVNTAGGNGWWEQCAQWQAFKVFPELQFTDSRFTNYLNTAHKHILHEAPRYDNYFIQDFFTYKHGMDIIGRLWNESKRPEDPVEAYKRITSISQEEFNDEMYEHAARFASWDIPVLKASGTSRISARPQTKMKSAGDNYWLVDAASVPENYGYNVIRLNAPQKATTVAAYFKGQAGIDGYRKNYLTSAGWRFGFVALLSNGTRVYSDMSAASYANPSDTVFFNCPDNCRQLWLVVSGAPTTHWRHAWDDDDSNDEQWPYQVKFNNTNLLGYQNVVSSIHGVQDIGVVVYSKDNGIVVDKLPGGSVVSICNIIGSCVTTDRPVGESLTVKVPAGMYVVSIQNNGQRYNQKVIVP